jgi:hypothetical protein
MMLCCASVGGGGVGVGVGVGLGGDRLERQPRADGVGPVPE